MKGISHFAVGVAAASCFPEAVKAGAAGNPLYFVLGAAFGLLPDTLDFKFYRFFYKHDIEVRPDPKQPDPQMIADGVALAMNRAYETRKPVRVKLDTVRLGTDQWQRYTVTFDVARRRVAVAYGPVVDTGGSPLDHVPTPKAPEAGSSVACNIRLDYQATTAVDILDGPLFEMAVDPDGSIRPVFIPWHREWSHSVPFAVVMSVLAGVVWGPLAGLVAFCAFAGHIGVDQLGHMGNNLFWPFRSRRIDGLRLTHSGDALPNFSTVWLSCMVVFWNLYGAGNVRWPHLNVAGMFAFAAVMPILLYRLAVGRTVESQDDEDEPGGG